MPKRFEARTDILPQAQKEIWPQLSPAQQASFVLYGGTAVALHLGHRVSVDFDFFRTEPLDKAQLNRMFAFVRDGRVIQDQPDTLVVMGSAPSGPVKVSFFGGMGIRHVNQPDHTSDSVLLVASLDDLLATKLKAILDRAEAKDYRDIAAMISAGTSLERALAAFAKMFKSDPILPLKALGFFKDGDLPTLSQQDRKLLSAARDAVIDIPEIELRAGTLVE